MSPSVRVPSHAVVPSRTAAPGRATDPPRTRPSARRRALVFGVALVAGCVSACSGGTEPDPTPVETSAEPSPTQTPEPSPTETGPAKPERPAAMDRDDAEGAAAAAEYFLELYPYIMTSSDTAEWEAMSHQECGYCSESLANARWLSDSGSVFTGGETTVEILTSYARDSQTGIFPLDVRTHQEPIEVSDAAGQSVETVPRDTVELRIEMGRNSGSWVVVEVAPMPKDEG